MNRLQRAGLFAGIAIGIVSMAMPFLFPNMGALAAAAFFGVGSIMTAVCLRLIAVGTHQNP